jgi:tetratricopeptide (TPR) repeat protein
VPYDVFVSYSRRDNEQGDGRISEFVERLRQDFAVVAGRPLVPFFDKDEIQGMDDWRDRILQSLRQSQLLIACLTPSYLASEYCQWEFVEYLKKEVARGYLGEGVAPIYFVDLPGSGADVPDQAGAEWIAELNRRHRFDVRAWFGDSDAASREAAVREPMANLTHRIVDRIRRGEQAERSLGNVDAHNPHFVGRVAELRSLRNHFSRPGTIGVVTAVHGLGGVGKTAVALEYAHACAHEYGGGRWQVRCEGRDDLRAALATLAPALRVDFSETERTDPEFQFQRILAELRHLAQAHEPHRCLLLLDNVDQPNLVDPAQTQHLPAAEWLHIIATTRLGERDLFGPQKDRAFLSIDELPEPDALALIEQYQPDGRFREEAERRAALEIVGLLDRFTLAVEATAVFLGYYASHVSCTAFLERLRTEGLEGLEVAATDPQIRVRHRETRLTATLLPTLEQLSPAEQLALDYAALLPPDCVSWEWLEVLVGDQFEEFAQAVPDGYLDPWTALRAHLLSLRLLTVAADPEVAHIHRMVQAVVRSRPEFKRDRLRARLIEYALEQCRILEEGRYDPEALQGLKPLTAWALLLIEQDPAKGVFLQSALGRLLLDLAHFYEAEPLLVHALRVSAELFGAFDLKVASPLNDLGILFHRTNRLDQAEPLFRRALAITKNALGPDHRRVASCLNNLAQLLHATNRLGEAEPLMRRALAIDEQSCGQEHPDVARKLNNLAALLRATSRLAEAEPLMRRALAIDEQFYGQEHPEVATDLNNLAQLLQDTNRLAEAEPLMRRVVTIVEKSLGGNHPDVAMALNNLAALLQATNRLAEAEPLMRRALAIDEQSYGEEHPVVATDLNNLAALLQATNRLAEAEPLMRRVVTIFEKSLGENHPNVASALNNLAALLEARNRPAEAEPLMRRVIKIFQAFSAATGYEHPDSRLFIDNYWAVLQAMNISQPEIEAKVRDVLGPGPPSA